MTEELKYKCTLSTLPICESQPWIMTIKPHPLMASFRSVSVVSLALIFQFPISFHLVSQSLLALCSCSPTPFWASRSQFPSGSLFLSLSVLLLLKLWTSRMEKNKAHMLFRQFLIGNKGSIKRGPRGVVVFCLGFFFLVQRIGFVIHQPFGAYKHTQCGQNVQTWVPKVRHLNLYFSSYQVDWFSKDPAH